MEKDQNSQFSLASFMTGLATAGTVGGALFAYKYSDPVTLLVLPAMWGWHLANMEECAEHLKKPRFSFKQAAAGAAIVGGVLLAGDKFIEHRLGQYDQPLTPPPHSQSAPEPQ